LSALDTPQTAHFSIVNIQAFLVCLGGGLPRTSLKALKTAGSKTVEATSTSSRLNVNDTDILTAHAKTFWEVIEALKEAVRDLESKWIDTVSSMSEPN
jgi:hypothetical protein